MYEATTKIDGRNYYVLVPDGETDTARGVITGPPDLSSLNLPEDVEERLHNELFVRGMKNKRVANKRRDEVFASLQAAFSVNTDKILECYDAS